MLEKAKIQLDSLHATPAVVVSIPTMLVKLNANFVLEENMSIRLVHLHASLVMPESLQHHKVLSLVMNVHRANSRRTLVTLHVSEH